MPNVQLIAEDHLWSPHPDDEIKKRGQRFIEALGLHNVFLQSGACDLSRFAPTSKLYILAHGHSSMPFFANSNGRWSATQLAKMLEADGLPKDQRDIELLVCHAGESVNDRKTGAKLVSLYEKSVEARAQNKSTDKIASAFNATAAKGSKPQFFEGDPEKLLLPLAAELAQALKLLGYTHFAVIAYKCPVAQYNPDANVYLDLSEKGGQWGEKAKDHPTYRVVWR